MKSFLKLLKYSAIALILTSCSSGGGNSGGDGGDDPVDEGGYKCTVLTSSGSPVEDVMVMWCDDSRCYTPSYTDENGVASNSKLPDNTTFSVHLSRIPEGYAYNPNVYTSSPENKEITITLSDIAASNGSGTKESPFIFDEGVYSVALNQESGKDTSTPVYFKVSSSCTVESWADKSIAAMVTIDADLYSVDGDTMTILDENSGAGNNFQKEISEIDSLMAIVATANDYPTNLIVSVSK